MHNRAKNDFWGILGSTVHCFSITTFGIKQNEYSDVFHKILTMDDLF